MTENTSPDGRITLGVDKNIKNDVITYLASKGVQFTGDDTIMITNAGGGNWIINLYWN